ncbi:hypothetical protein [Rhodopseudomonas sp. B29]|uniref:hypothetical protein n=1 Tax=Rhodopseudomonas sp. B29 TaxID=95607 RepID=UPI00034D2351|nr:hypothetical protein [Rhodopseudomonas sp. B29]
MNSNWRISTAAGILVAAYFVPAWLKVAFGLMVSPIHGLFDRPNIAVGLFLSNHFHLGAEEAIRIAWLLALAKLTVIAFFAVFVALAARRSVRVTGGCDEALSIALTLGSVICFASMILASHGGEAQALRLHATELLLLVGTAIVMLVERPPLPAKAEERPSRMSTYTAEHFPEHV